MRTLLAFFLLVFLPMSALAQAGLVRNVVTTNLFMNDPSDGWIAIWNNVAKKWSNGVNTASATNNAQPPSTILTNLSITGAITNLGNIWQVWSDAATQYHAFNYVTNLVLQSNDFSGLMQQVVNFAGIHGYIHIAGNPIYTSVYNVSNTITITNSCVIQGDGNPSSVLKSQSPLNGPIFAVGTIAIAIPSINRFNDLRFEGDNAGAAGTGIRFVNCPEPVVERCEFSNFKFAGVQLSSTNGNHWSYMMSSWFVMLNGGIGVLIDREPLDSQSAELFINNCFFGIGDGKGIISSNRYRTVSIQSSRFRWFSPFATSIQGIQLYAGENYTIANNTFEIWPQGSSPIRFESRATLTNYNSIVSGNNTFSIGASAPTNVVYVGTNVQGVTLIGNNSPDGTGYALAGTNGASLIVDKNTSFLPGILSIGTNLQSPAAGIGSLTATNWVRNFGTLTNGGKAWFSNDVDVGGSFSVIVNTYTGGYFTNNAIAVLNAVLGGGAFQWNGAFNSFAQDLTLNGPVIANDSLRIPRAGDPTTDDFGEIAADDNAWAASRGALQFYDGTANTFLVGVLKSDVPSNGQVPVWNTGGTITWENQSGAGAGGGPFNINQFAASSTHTNIKDGALFTNTVARGITMPNVTASRAAAFNANGDITNAATTTTAELDFVSGVTSAIQTQLNGKQNGQTNSAQFGPSTTLTLRDGVTVTNLNNIGTMNLTNPPGASAKLRIWQTNGLAYTEFSLPEPWLPTNSLVLWLTNASVGKLLKVNSVSIASGVATINFTNDFANGSEVLFDDPDGKFAATSVSGALAELNDANGSGPNASDGKVNWQQLVNVPAGFADGIDAGGTNNVAQGIGTADITNAVKRYWVVLNGDTNVVLNWSVTNYYIVSPTNTFTISWINPPAAGAPAQSMFLELRNTNSAAGYFPTNGFNNSPVIMLASPSTNTYAFNFDGTNFWIDSGQILTTGLGDTNVFNQSPTIFDLRIPLNGITSNYVWTATNAATGQGEWRPKALDDTNLFTGKILYVFTNGNDATAVRGDLVHPWANITNALAVALSGDTVQVGPGSWVVTNNFPIKVPVGVTLKGSGRGSTFLQNGIRLVVDGPCIQPGSTSIVAGFTIVGISGTTNYQAAYGVFQTVTPSVSTFTNALLRDCQIIEHDTDGIYVRHTNRCDFEIRNCYVQTKWDTVAVQTTNTHTVRIYDSQFRSIGPSAALDYTGIAVGLGILAGQVTIENSSSTTTNATVNNYAFTLQDNGSSALVRNCFFRGYGTGAADITTLGGSAVVYLETEFGINRTLVLGDVRPGPVTSAYASSGTTTNEFSFQNIGSLTANSVILQSSNTTRWRAPSTDGHLIPLTSNRYDVGTYDFPVRTNVAVVSIVRVAESNAMVGGVTFKQVTVPAFTNLNTTIATFTNAALWKAPAHTLTNTGDSMLVIWRGNALAGTNNLKAIYGLETVLDTGNFTNAFTAWELGMEITRTGNSTAHADAWLTFNQVGPALTSFGYSGIRTNLEIAPVNGVANTNLLQLASNRAGGISNNYMRVYWEPASK